MKYELCVAPAAHPRPVPAARQRAQHAHQVDCAAALDGVGAEPAPLQVQARFSGPPGLSRLDGEIKIKHSNPLLELKV